MYHTVQSNIIFFQQSATERILFDLPVGLGGLGITDPLGLIIFQCKSSQEVTKLLTILIVQNNTTFPSNTRARQQQIKAEIRKTRQRANKNTDERTATKSSKVMYINCEKGTASWLSTLPTSEHGFALHNGTFR